VVARSVVQALVAAGLLVSLAGCSASPPGNETPDAGPVDEITAIPFPSTVQLSSSDLSSLQPDPGDGTLVFTSPPASLAGVDVGMILVAGVSPGTPAGLLRAVLSVDRSGGQLVLRTAEAPIQLAYSKLHAKLTRSTAVVAGGSAAPLRSAALSEDASFDVTVPFSYVLFDGDGDLTTTNDQIVTDGTIGGGFDYSFGLDFDWGGLDRLPQVVSDCLKSFAGVLVGDKPSCSIDDLLPEAKVGFDVDPTIHGNANVHGAAIYHFDQPVDLASTTLTPIVLGPLVFVPTVDLTADLSGGASGTFQTGIHGGAEFETSVSLSSKHPGTPRFSSPVLKSTTFDLNETRITLHAEAQIAVGARLNLLLYGVTGPFAHASTYARVEADLLGSPCWALYAGIEVDLGVKITTPAIPLIGEVTLAEWTSPEINPFEIKVSDGQCDPPPDAPTLPPGSGADAEHFARPTYTPWSRTFASSTDGALSTSPGNSVVFSDQQRTIDGNYVRAGFALEQLVKLDDGGNTIWARALQLDGAPIRPDRIRPSPDATMMIASGHNSTLVLTRLAQDGTVVDARAFDVPIDSCSIRLTSLSADGPDGWALGGSCVEGTAFLLRVPAAGDASLEILDAGASTHLNLRVTESLGTDLFVAGAISDPYDAMFALRLDPQGNVVWSKRYQACDDAPDTIPSAAVVGSQGDVTLAGSGGAQHNAMVARIHPDGSVGFAAFPGFGFGASRVFLLDSIAELPTTGYVAGGSTVQLTDGDPLDVPAAVLAGLDAGGSLLWANRYTFGPAASHSASGEVGVRLSDDGGIFATAVAVDPSDSLGGLLWAFKPFAKDGSITFSPDTVTAQPLDVTNLACSLTASDRAISVRSTPLSGRSAQVTSTAVAVQTATQGG